MSLKKSKLSSKIDWALQILSHLMPLEKSNMITGSIDERTHTYDALGHHEMRCLFLKFEEQFH